MTKWQDKTRGGYPVRFLTEFPEESVSFTKYVGQIDPKVGNWIVVQWDSEGSLINSKMPKNPADLIPETDQ